jgi:hypothetical protein
VPGGRDAAHDVLYNRRIREFRTLRVPWASLWAAAVGAATLVWVAWLYRLPPGYPCTWGSNEPGAAHFAAVLHVPWGAVDAGAFRLGFRVWAALACLTYLGLLASALARAPSRRSIAWIAGVTALIAALAGPPALSEDLYAYVGYARLALVHHLNPYEATQRTLVELGDPTRRFLRWPIHSPYGPLWTLVSMGAVAATPRASLWGAIVLLKLVGATSLLAMAEGGRRLAERLSPGRGGVVFAALALNPLFLVEGVANGHNDVVMMALVLWAFVAAEQGLPRRALLLVGLACALKFVPLLLVPWLLVRAVRRAPPARRVLVALSSLALALGPLGLAFAAFWRGSETLAGLRARTAMGQTMAGGDPRAGLALLLALYAGTSWWVLRGEGARRDLGGWVVASLGVVLLASGVPFPWYLIWPWAAALVLVEGSSVALSAALFGLAIVKVMQYTS